MIGRSAAPRILAAAVIASSSIDSVGNGNGLSGSVTSARLAQVSSAHSSATGRGRPEVACQIACETRVGASCGLRMRSAHLVMWRIRPSWSWISCRWPWPLSMSACGIWPIRPITGAFMP